MRVLLIEDDPTTAKSVELMLTHANINVYRTDLAEEGLDLAKLYSYDMIVLEIAIDDGEIGITGFEMLRQLRLCKINTPVLVLSRNDDTQSKLKAFDFGADDYLTKPFHREELVARIYAIVRRYQGRGHSVVSTGTLNVNLDTQVVDVAGRRINLTRKEYQLLELLSLRKGTVLTKEMFLNHLYGSMDQPELKIVDVLICKLRTKLSRATDGENYIETVWGRGYVLCDPAPATIAAD